MIPTGINPFGLEDVKLTFHIFRNGTEIHSETAYARKYCYAEIPYRLQYEYGTEWAVQPCTTRQEYDGMDKYVSSESQTGDRFMVYGNQDFYLAENDECIATFDANGGLYYVDITLDYNDGETPPEVLSHPIGYVFDQIPQAQRVGHTFLGWKGSDDVTMNSGYVVMHPETFHAQWRQKQEFTWTFDAGDGLFGTSGLLLESGHQTQDFVELNGDGVLELNDESTSEHVTHSIQMHYTEGDLHGPIPEPHRSGYAFGGWAESSSGTSVAFPDAVTDNRTYYAVWIQDID